MHQSTIRLVLQYDCSFDWLSAHVLQVLVLFFAHAIYIFIKLCFKLPDIRYHCFTGSDRMFVLFSTTSMLKFPRMLEKSGIITLFCSFFSSAGLPQLELRNSLRSAPRNLNNVSATKRRASEGTIHWSLKICPAIP